MKPRAWNTWDLWPSREDVRIESEYDTAMYAFLNRPEDSATSEGPFERIRGWRWSQTRLRIFARDRYQCRYCKSFAVRLECDHVIPVSRGGSNDDKNLVTGCFSCNRSKRDKLLSEWVMVHG